MVEYIEKDFNLKKQPEIERLVHSLQMASIVLRSKLYFMERRLSRAGVNLETMNELINRNSHIL